MTGPLSNRSRIPGNREIVAVYPVPASYSKRKRVAALAGDGRFAEKKRGFPRQRERPVVDRPAVFPGVRAGARTFTDLSVMKRYGEQPEVRVKLWTVSEQGSEGT